jgi:SAM-dependent methyltransferase
MSCCPSESGSTAERCRAVKNVDTKTVEGFGREWARFDQSGMRTDEAREAFELYFRVFPWSTLPRDAVGFDLGCGSGRWAKMVAPRVGTLHCIDASGKALDVAKSRLAEVPNVVFHHASVSNIPLSDNSMDFGYSLGVLHHIPDTAAGLKSCAMKLKRGAPFLVYLYYAFDNRPAWFRALWRISNAGRQILSRAPAPLRAIAAETIAACVYAPLAWTAGTLEGLGVDVETFPLSAYRRRSFYTMRTDALDRFGTRLEHRFTVAQVRQMMEAAGLHNIVVSDALPYWTAVGIKS